MKINKIGVLQALGVTAYCSLIALIMWNGEKIFGETDSYLGPLSFLVLFSTSALTCGLIVFYKPYKLFFEGKKKEAIEVILSTVISLFAILLGLFFVVIYFK